MTVKVWPVPKFPESNVPASDVAVWVAPSLFVHLTDSPALMLRVAGSKADPRMATSRVAGGVLDDEEEVELGVVEVADDEGGAVEVAGDGDEPPDESGVPEWATTPPVPWLVLLGLISGELHPPSRKAEAKRMGRQYVCMWRPAVTRYEAYAVMFMAMTFTVIVMAEWILQWMV